MLGRKSVAILATLAMTICASARAESIGQTTSQTTAATNEFKITDTDPGPAAWGIWDQMITDQPISDVRVTTPVHASLREQPTPVAPMPPAFVSGGSVIIAAAMLRLVRKLKLA